MPVAANAQQLHVDAAGPLDRGFIPPAIIVHVVHRHRAVGNVDILRGDIDVPQEVFVHPAVIALQLIVRQPVVFVQVESDHARKVEPLFAVQPDQLAIDAQRGRTGGQPQHGHLAKAVPLADHAGNGLRDVPRQFAV